MAETTMAETTMVEMVCGRNVLWPNRSVAETSRKPYYHWVDVTAGGHFVPKDIIRPVAII